MGFFHTVLTCSMSKFNIIASWKVLLLLLTWDKKCFFNLSKTEGLCKPDHLPKFLFFEFYFIYVHCNGV